MVRSCRSEISLRLGAMVAFLAYLLAGASLALPSEMRCSRCPKLIRAATIKPGMSCSLSSNAQHCHHSHGKAKGKITLCPDGCVRHDGQSGEIPSLAKFLSTPAGDFMVWVVVGAVDDNPPFPTKTSLPSLYHPPPCLA